MLIVCFNFYILCDDIHVCGLFVVTDGALHSDGDIVPVQSCSKHDFITSAVDDGASRISDSTDFFDVNDDGSDMSDQFAVFRLLFVSYKLQHVSLHKVMSFKCKCNQLRIAKHVISSSL